MKHHPIRFCGWLLAVCAILAAASARPLRARYMGPVEIVATTPRNSDAPTGKLCGKLTLFPLSNDYFVLAGDYDEAFNERILAAFGERLSMADKLHERGTLPAWSYRFFYNFATAEILGENLGPVAENFQNPAYFQIQVNGQTVQAQSFGYWVNAIGCKRTPHAAVPGNAQTNSAQLIFFAYFKLPCKLENGDVLAISTTAGEKAEELVYNDRETLSRAIKVNQVGYAAEAGRKYAYLGCWLGPDLGAFPSEQYEGREFFLRRLPDHRIVFQGKIALRGRDQTIAKNSEERPLTGETVCEMDFSAFSEPGRYYIQVPGIGCSWDFIIGNDAVGRAFYVQMRGLYHQRSGMAKEKAFTQWSMKRDHPVSYRGGFVPNDRHYSSCFRDEEGNVVKVKHFDMIRATATDEVLENVYGGWWDAGDFDRRPYHFQVVDELLSMYFLFPENFSDGQLDLPESGNGIPDIIDEAAWGVDVWRRAQNEKGGVGCWLEAKSHPICPDPELDTQHYYLALPTRESTLEYCIYAQKLARAYRACGALEKAELFHQSALKAWAFVQDPQNRLTTRFQHPKLGFLTYEEPQELPQDNLLKALFNLYLWDHEETYARQLDQLDFSSI